MLVFAKTLSGRSTSLEVQHTDTVYQVKRKIWEKEGVHPSEQRIIFQGVELEDNQVLSDLNIKDETVLYLLGYVITRQ